MEALEKARALLEGQQMTLGDRERLYGYLEGGGKIVLPEPQPLLTEAGKMVGLDGQKMSKSYDNTIGLREDPESVAKKLKTMPTDPARVRRKDPGRPGALPGLEASSVYSDERDQSLGTGGLPQRRIGCLDCKQHVIDAVLAEQVRSESARRSMRSSPTWCARSSPRAASGARRCG